MTMVIDMVGSQGSRYNFLRSCRFGYSHTLPILYRDVEFWTKSTLAHDQSRPQAACREVHHGTAVSPQFWSMYSFANCVLGNPNLAAHVKTFTLHGSMCICYERRDDVNRRYEVSDMIRRAVERRALTRDGTREWLAQIGQGYDMDTLLTVILPALPRMEKLDCNIHECADWTLSMLSLFHLYIEDENGDQQPAYKTLLPPFAFSKLHTVTNQADMDFCRKSLFLSLPAMKCLAGKCDGYEYTDDIDVDFIDEIEYKSVDLPEERPYSVVEEINLHLVGNCLINVQEMIESCFALKTLKLTLTYPFHIFYALQRFRKALLPAQHTLETLELLYTPIEPLTWEEEPMSLDLKQFTRLRSLKLGMAFVFGGPPLHQRDIYDPDSDWLNDRVACFDDSLTDMLPPTIETLYLRRYRGEALSGIALFKSLGELLEKIPSRFPLLTSVTVDIAKHHPRDFYGKNFRSFMRKNESLEVTKWFENNARDHMVDLRIRRIIEE